MKFYIALVIAALAVSGCGKSDSSKTTGGSGAADSSTPAGGDGKSNAIEGTWVRVSGGIPGTQDEIDFLKNNRADFGDGTNSLPLEYQILDDGKLRCRFGFETTNYQPTISGDQLELKDLADGSIARYRRLKHGETVQDALKAAKESDIKAKQDRNGALLDFLKNSDLVMEQTSPSPDGPPAIALELAGASGAGFSGKAFHDDKSPHLNAISASIVEGQDKTKVQFNLGQQIQPAAAPNAQPISLNFNVTGDAKNLHLATQLGFGDAGKSYDVVVKHDPALHKQIVDRFNAELARIDALKQGYYKLLKDYAVLQGRSQSSNPSELQGNSDRIILVRDPATNVFAGEVQSVSKQTGITQTFKVIGAIVVGNEQAALQVVSVTAQPARLYILSMADASSGKLSGRWQLQGRPTAQAAQLDVTQALDDKGKQALFAAQKSTLLALTSDTSFQGVISDQAPPTAPPYPVTVALTGSAGSSFTGKAYYPGLGCAMTVNGRLMDTPFGPQISLQFAGGQPTSGPTQDGQAFIQSQRSAREAWTLGVAGDSKSPLKLEGNCAKNGGNSAFELDQMSDQARADFKQKLMDALSSGVQFKVRTPEMGAAPDTVMDFKLDSATSKISGKLVSGGTHVNMTPGSTWDGQLAEQDGWAVFDLIVHRAVGRGFHDYGYRMLVGERNGALYLTGWTFNLPNGLAGGGRFDAYQVKA